MRILVLAPDYPKPGRLFGGIFNERCVDALKELCDRVEVLVPRPYAPPLLSSLVPRWKIHFSTPAYEVKNGVPVYRPATPVVPRIGGAFWLDQGAFMWCRGVARQMHRRRRFDAILSFDLVGAGGIAWRIGQDIGIPASGWATGNVGFPANSSYGRVVIRALQRLDLVFYQSHELLNKAAGFLGIPPAQMAPNRHIALPRGIPEPPLLSRVETRNRVRREWRVKEDQVLVLYIGRISREKGAFELLDAVSLAAARNSRITCILVGSSPAYDETAAVQKTLDDMPAIKQKIRLLPACNPDKVWEYLCAADIFAFTSHHEGMPNSLLEAMVMGIPTIAFAIPPVLEIEAGTGAPLLVPPLDSKLFSEAVVWLAASPDDRVQIGKKGRELVMDRFMVKKNMALALDRLARVVQKELPSPNRPRPS